LKARGDAVMTLPEQIAALANLSSTRELWPEVGDGVTG